MSKVNDLNHMNHTKALLGWFLEWKISSPKHISALNERSLLTSFACGFQKHFSDSLT
jgi:hypothetical protein